MLVSYFAHFAAEEHDNIPNDWPVPPAYYDREEGGRGYAAAMEQVDRLEELGYDWVSVSEHHYHKGQSPTPNLISAFMAARTKRIKIALLGPHMPLNNPVRVAEELALLDQLSNGRVVAGLLRGTVNEFLTYGVNPAESRDLTTEGMELVLKAWTEPQPFGWEGRHYQFRTVSVWPRPRQTPFPPTYILGGSKETSDFAALHRLGMAVAFSPFQLVGRSTAYYREACDREGWRPSRDQVIYRANIMIGETDAQAESFLEAHRQRAKPPFPLRQSILQASQAVNPTNPIPGSTRDRAFESALPVTFRGGPKTIIEQVQQCREEVGAGVIDLGFLTPVGTQEAALNAIELFGREVLPYIRDV